MAKLLFKVGALLFIVVGISNYVLYIKTGKSPFTNISNTLSFQSPEPPSILPAKKQQAYKWVDAQGVTHYSSEAPAHQNAEILEVDPKQNLIQGVTVSNKTKSDEEKTDAATHSPIGNPYNPETIHKLMNDAKAVQNTLNERYQTLDSID